MDPSDTDDTFDTQAPARADVLAASFEMCRAELTSYLTRLVVRQSVAQELAQTTILRALEAIDSAPSGADECRPWLFRIATNLALNERKRHGSWRETLLVEAEDIAMQSESFTAKMDALRGSPEMKTVAKEHLTVCFSCVLGELPSNHAAALLLKEVYAFDLSTIAQILELDSTQVKNCLQKARATMRKRYSTTCALVAKQGICYQCCKLDDRFEAGQGNPLAGAEDTMSARLDVLRELRENTYGTWGQMVVSVIDRIQ